MRTQTGTSGLAAWGVLLQVYANLVPVVDRELQAATDLSLAWYDILLELHDAEDRRLRMSELADRVVLSRTRVSRVVDDLAAAGLVRREPDPLDRRSSFAVLTAAGRRRFVGAAPIYLRSVERHFGRHLSASEEQTLARALVRVHEAERAAQSSPR